MLILNMDEQSVNQTQPVTPTPIITPPETPPTVISTPVTPQESIPTPDITPPPVINPTPVTPPTNSFFQKNILLIIIGGVLLLAVILFFVFKNQLFSPSDKKTSSKNIFKQPTPTSIYVQDTDSDSIPDVIEQGINLDPNSSEFIRCQLIPCDDATKSDTASSKNNILFIIDSSGSMGLKIGDKTKMELAKEAINRFMTSVNSNVNIGIMVYGNKGSNSQADKAASCASAEVIAPVGSVTSSSISTYLSQINPVGWTPIGLAIKNGINAFSGKEGQKNQIIVVTDGAETCDSNPTGAASQAKSSAYAIKVDVIGFAVNATEQSALQSIATNGGGLFSVAINSDQLYNQMKSNSENWDKYQSNTKCIITAYQTSIDCHSAVKTKVFSYLGEKIQGTKGIEWSNLSNMQDRISSMYQDKIYSLQDEQSAKQKAIQQNLLNQ